MPFCWRSTRLDEKRSIKVENFNLKNRECRCSSKHVPLPGKKNLTEQPFPREFFLNWYLDDRLSTGNLKWLCPLFDRLTFNENMSPSSSNKQPIKLLRVLGERDRVGGLLAARERNRDAPGDIQADDKKTCMTPIGDPKSHFLCLHARNFYLVN